MWEIALAFLKANWKWIAVGIAALSLITYIKVIQLERNHYKNEYQQVQLKLDTLVTTSKANEEHLKNDNEALSHKYANTLRDANTLVTANAGLNERNIKLDKELAATKLSLNAVRLFNASKQPASTEAVAADTKPGNDAEAASTKVSSSSLADMMLIVNENDANHLRCIATVEQWQKFWNDYVAIVEANNARNN